MHMPRFQAAKPAKFVDIDGRKAQKILHAADRIFKISEAVR